MIKPVEIYRGVEITRYLGDGPLPPYVITGGWWLPEEGNWEAVEEIINAVRRTDPDNSIVDDCESSQMFFCFSSVKDARVAIDVLHAEGRIVPADARPLGDVTDWLTDIANRIRETLAAVGYADNAMVTGLRGRLAALTIAADVAEAVRTHATSDEQAVRIFVAVVAANAELAVSDDERAGWQLIAEQLRIPTDA